MAKMCNSKSLAITEINTNGGVANLQLIRDNKTDAAIVPSDLLWQLGRKNGSAIANIKQIFPLHQEFVHVIVRADTKVEGGFNLGKLGNIGGDKITFTKPEDFAGRPIGAVGGSAESARILDGMLHIGWKVTEPKPATTVGLLNALAAHQTDGVVIVGSVDAVRHIDGTKFKLLALRGTSDTQEAYTAVKAQYPNLNDNQPVDTLAEQALLVSKVRYDEDEIAKLSEVRGCLVGKLNKLRDKGNPAWTDISASPAKFLEWYPLPGATAVAVAPTKAKAPKK
jgi:hypothetical protein